MNAPARNYKDRGLYLDLPAQGAQLFRFQPTRGAQSSSSART